MISIAEGRAMAKRKGRPPGKRTERDDRTVKMDKAIVAKAKAVATHRGIPVAEFLSEINAVPVDRAYAQMLKELGGKGLE
jgi:hypothetical protein